MSIRRKGRKKKNRTFYIDEECIGDIPIDDKYISISKLVSNINSIIYNGCMKNIKRSQVESFLEQRGFLEFIIINGKRRHIADDSAMLIGISARKIKDQATGREYDKLMFSPDGQRYIIAMVNEIAKIKTNNTRKTYAFY
ncbi:MAG: hypothetical protein ACI4EA_04665 [Candidatus Ornithomonoglobus sp.]